MGTAGRKKIQKGLWDTGSYAGFSRYIFVCASGVVQGLGGYAGNENGQKPDADNPGEKELLVDMDDGEFEAGSVYFPEEETKGFNKYNVFFSKNTFKIAVTAEAGTWKSLLLVKHSFTNCFVPFLTEDYDQIVMLDYRYEKVSVKNIIEQYKNITDVLVMFNTEKFMQNTKLNRLTHTGKGETGKKEFAPEEFLE